MTIGNNQTFYIINLQIMWPTSKCLIDKLVHRNTEKNNTKENIEMKYRKIFLFGIWWTVTVGVKQFTNSNTDSRDGPNV